MTPPTTPTPPLSPARTRLGLREIGAWTAGAALLVGAIAAGMTSAPASARASALASGCIVCLPSPTPTPSPTPSPSHTAKPAKPAQPDPTPAPGDTFRAVAKRDVVHIYQKRGGKEEPNLKQYNPNEHGSQLNLLVLRIQQGWAQVRLPMRPNGTTGWIRLSEVNLVSNPWKIVVERDTHRLSVYNRDSVQRVFPVAVGSSQSPTPGGNTYLEALNATGGSSSYGPYAYGLGLHSNTYSEYAGGDGQIAIHGTSSRSSIGQSVSHGCVRMYNEDITALVDLHLPLGTPVEIH